MKRISRVVCDNARSVFGWVSVALLTVLFFFPLALVFLAVVPFDCDRKRLHVIVSLWARMILVVCPVMRVRIEGSELLSGDRAYVLVANHQSHADILTVLHLAHPFKFVAKKDLFWIPFLGWALSLVGYIPLDRSSRVSGKEVMKRASQYLGRGTSVLFFPEGTRSRDGEIHDFRVGAFKIAAEHDVPVVPIVIYGTRDVMTKGSPVVGASRKVTLQIGRARLSEGKGDAAIDRFVNEVRSDMIQQFAALRSQA